MALLLSLHPSILVPNPKNLCFFSLRSPIPVNPTLSPNRRLSSFPILASFSGQGREFDPPVPRKIPINNPDPKKPENKPVSKSGKGGKVDDNPGTVDEWGEKAEFEPVDSATKLSESDPPKDEDEWGNDAGSSDYLSGNGSASGYDTLGDLKRCLVDSLYGTEFGFRASTETRAEVVELINQLEVENPTTAPTQETSLLDGNWVLLYTAFSELLPLIAAGTSSLLKLKKITQAIDTGSFTIQNTATFSSPVATFSFGASASFEVQSSSRIQVKFKEGVFQPPKISSSIGLPESVDIFGQKIDLLPLQRSLNPVQEAVANVLRAISGQPPLRVPIPGERAQSWLVTTYLDKDLRISRGDGGLFVLAKEGSPLLDNL